MNESYRNIAEHLDKKLTDIQREDIDKALLELVEKEKLDYTKLKNDGKLHA